jgi:hypothetical protein
MGIFPPPLRFAPLGPPSRRYRLFISHAWDYKDEYERLVKLLNTDIGFIWENLSVPEENPLPVLLRDRPTFRGK